MLTTQNIREIFLNYFHQKGHTIVPGSSLIPASDPTLLFTNAGMVQFKDVFLGVDKRSYKRATTVQPCLRAGGKHNDLEQVGFTARHHTFFEMLGNFSFGDYFKRDAIHFAWELLTKEFKLPTEKLWITVYEEDDEAADIWLKEIGVDKKRFSRCGMKDNFWAMGDTGPCGPCSEIFYDHGAHIAGGPPGSDDEGDRYVEIWNLVFMQFNRDEKGNMTPLPKPSVDTGMGLERIAAVLQGVHNNYDIDIFKVLITDAAKIIKTKDLASPSLKVIADHIRASAFLITDGVMPSNEGRGYVLRRIIRRAIRYGNKLGVHESFFYRLVPTLVKIMGEAYPQLVAKEKLIAEILKEEEEQFARTIDQGLKVFEASVENLKTKILPGDVVFKLYDTYGFPVDLTAMIAKERGLSIDEKGFEKEMDKQRKQSQAASAFQIGEKLEVDQAIQTEFVGYETYDMKAKVIAIFKDQKPVSTLSHSETGYVILDKTPFYAESGGQAGDQGFLKSATGTFTVKDTQKMARAYLQAGEITSGKICVGETVEAIVDVARRKQTAAHHSATHLLHAALRKVLGSHVMQKGSSVHAERLRFDFTHRKALTTLELKEVENLVNAKIRENLPIETHVMMIDEAKKSGALAFFDEKYGEAVRVLTMGDFSKELCGGTHAHRTGDIGLLKIVAEEAIAAGVRRIEAVTGEAALNFIESQMIEKERAIENLLNEKHELEKKCSQFQAKLAQSKGQDLVSQVRKIKDISVLTAILEGVEPKQLRDLVDQLKNQLKSVVVLLATVKPDKTVSLIAGVTPDFVKTISAGELVQYVANQIDGKGGGRPDMAQGGGTDSSRLEQVFKDVDDWIAKKT